MSKAHYLSEEPAFLLGQSHLVFGLIPYKRAAKQWLEKLNLPFIEGIGQQFILK